MENSLIYQVQLLLSYHKISFDKEELAFQIQSHPSYPSLHSITGVLEHFGIDNLALDIPATQEVLKQLPKSFIGQVYSEQGKDFVVVINKGQKIEVIKDSKTKEVYNPISFLKKFTGIIVAIEKTEIITEKHTISSNIRKGLLTLLGVLFAGLILVSYPSLNTVAYLILALSGFAVSLAIIKQQFGFQTNIGNALCSNADATKDCNAVLTSKGATVLKDIKLSDISLTYFGSLSSAIIISIIGNYNLTYLFMMSLLATPIIIYSIIYQSAFAKAWCPLCILIASILGIQSVIAGFYIENNINFDIDSILIYTILLIASISIWRYIKPKIELFKNLKQNKIEYFKFKRNFDLFKTVLDKSPQIDTEIPLTSEIVFGNKKAALQVVIVTSPFCGHCKPVHSLIENILQSKQNEVGITIRFNVNTDNKETNLYKITSRLTEIYYTNDADSCMQAMHDIYGEMTPQKWLSKWGSCKKLSIYGEVLRLQNEWCSSNSINFTPEILVDGRSFPKEYNREDLVFFIEDLSENCKNNCSNTVIQTTY